MTRDEELVRLAREFYDGHREGRVSAFPGPLSDFQGLMVGRDGSGYPEPSWASSAGLPEGVVTPRPVSALAVEAAGFGWHVVTAYAKGCVPHGITGRPLAERETWSVRFSRGIGPDWQGYAVYECGTSAGWRSIMVAGRTLPPFGGLGRTELSTWLSDSDQAASWYDRVREKLKAQAAARKDAAAGRSSRVKSEGLL